MKYQSYEELYLKLEYGKIYYKEMQLLSSNTIDQDLEILVEIGLLEKLSTKIYYKPKFSHSGKLPPDDEELISFFLDGDNFLLYSQESHNLLDLGLTQFHNELVVYNLKKHGLFKFGENIYNFRRLSNNLPTKLTAEFLLIDLLNNIENVIEDNTFAKKQIKNNLHKFDLNKIKYYANLHGTEATKYFFK